jgi:phosphotransferase system enzyme I (PtsI)
MQALAEKALHMNTAEEVVQAVKEATNL